MKTHKNLWAALLITVGWGAVMIFMEVMRFSNNFAIMSLIAVGVAFFATYQLLRLLDYIPDVLQKQSPKSQAKSPRFDDWLNDLNDDEMALLRHRLRDAEEDETVESLDHLLRERKPKRHSHDY